eukprot:3181067-Rhodomonas_salina.1
MCIRDRMPEPPVGSRTCRQEPGAGTRRRPTPSYGTVARDRYAVSLRNPYMSLRDCYAVSLSNRHVSLRDPYAMSLRNPYAMSLRSPDAMSLRNPYTMSGPNVGWMVPACSASARRKVSAAFNLRARPTRCPVLTVHMVLPVISIVEGLVAQLEPYAFPYQVLRTPYGLMTLLRHPRRCPVLTWRTVLPGVVLDRAVWARRRVCTARGDAGTALRHLPTRRLGLRYLPTRLPCMPSTDAASAGPQVGGVLHDKDVPQALVSTAASAGTDIARAATYARYAVYAVPGTDLLYAATRRKCLPLMDARVRALDLWQVSLPALALRVHPREVAGSLPRHGARVGSSALTRAARAPGCSGVPVGRLPEDPLRHAALLGAAGHHVVGTALWRLRAAGGVRAEKPPGCLRLLVPMRRLGRASRWSGEGSAERGVR